MIEITGYENIGKGKYARPLIMARHVCCTYRGRAVLYYGGSLYQ